MAFPDVQLDREFLDEHQDFIAALGQAMARQAVAQAGLHDPDVVEALEALARTYQTLDSGLYYEQLPEARPGRELYAALQDWISLWQHGEAGSRGAVSLLLRPGDILRSIVFLRRFASAHVNGRPLGRGFLDFLQTHFLDLKPSGTGRPPLIVPAG
jgi:hypothetical protein